MKMLAGGGKELLTTRVPVKLLLTGGVKLHPSITSALSREQSHDKNHLRWCAMSLGCVRCRVLLQLCRSLRSVVEVSLGFGLCETQLTFGHIPFPSVQNAGHTPRG